MQNHLFALFWHRHFRCGRHRFVAVKVIDFSSQHIGIEVSSLFGLTIENEVRC
jgi:hypothetical protein